MPIEYDLARGGPVLLEDVPQRIFLDSCVLQVMHRYGGFLHENEALPQDDPIRLDPLGEAKLDALRAILQVSERGSFEFALSENSLAEVGRARDSSYLRWAYDVLDYWLAFEAAEIRSELPARPVMTSASLGYLSEGDRTLLADALALNCDAFLTVESRLPKNSQHIEKVTGLRVLTPIGMWNLLRPWAALFR